jgi:hypothetical protein
MLNREIFMKGKSLGRAFAIVAISAFVVAHAQDIQLQTVQIPNDVSYWQKAGFVEMVPPLRLPTEKRNEDLIQVWIKVPEDRKISVDWLEGQQRFTLKFPTGTVADRVETVKHEVKALLVINGIEDVRGARIDNNGKTHFHVYEPVPGERPRWLRGYEWLRTDDQGDDLAAKSLIKLYYSRAKDQGQPEIQMFRRLNQCGACHQLNAPAPLTASQPFPRWISDSHGFFQPITILEDSMIVRSHRNWDLNADDPFLTVWCGAQQAQAITDGDSRGYKCQDDQVPIGKLQITSALEKKDSHALQVCESRNYLYKHMDEMARDAYRRFFQECSIN